MVDVSEAPLAGLSLRCWLDYLSAWDAGLPATNSLAVRFVEVIMADKAERATFGRWCLTSLYEPERGSSSLGGQWGGGLDAWWSTTPTRPREFALSKYPLPSRVLLPTLLECFDERPARFARMLFLFTTGLGFRLPPTERSQLAAIVAPYATSDHGLRPLLMLGRDVDPRARELLLGMDEDD
ncbi:hypothetical protein NY547_18385 [Cnuibacter physcomitrellae]|uniref:hypothetical protein n=1 Tax=Cnuibacter physcomitrellae TaxID=1619308 RepID=UPI0021758BBA|nr:hypothetical protein [Cnuibacter physcomitrellae]MCS5499216.1 hypothetical protein [Cnuibacter physcomitrellae]